ncbi:hypothetical protein Tco_1253257 [Tanacetum coccineum]
MEMVNNAVLAATNCMKEVSSTELSQRIVTITSRSYDIGACLIEDEDFIKRSRSTLREEVTTLADRIPSTPVWGCDRLVIRQGNREPGSRPQPIGYSFCDIPTVIPSTSVVAPETSTIAPVISSPLLWEAIPFGRPYRTHINWPGKLLTARKRVGPLPARRLAWRHASPRFFRPTPSSSSSSLDSSPVHSSGLDAPDQAHSGSSTRDVSPRLGYPPRRAPRCSEAFRHWFRDSYSSEASIEEDTKIDPIETEVDIELGIGDGDDVRDHVEIDPRDVRDDTEEYEADTSAGDNGELTEDSSDSSGTRDGIVRSFEDMPIDLRYVKFKDTLSQL